MRGKRKNAAQEALDRLERKQRWMQACMGAAEYQSGSQLVKLWGLLEPEERKSFMRQVSTQLWGSESYTNILGGWTVC